MGFGDILGQVMQGGLGDASASSRRLNNTAGNLDRQGGFDQIFGQLQDALSGGGGGTQGGGTLGGFADKAKEFLQKEQVGGLSGGQIGGIGAVAGALLGGGLGGAARGGAMAVLGTLALGALKRAQAGAQGTDPGHGQIQAEPDEIKQLVGPEAEKLAIRAMISAAKADGQIDRAEMQAIIGKLSADSVTEEEKQFVLDEMQRPVDVGGLAASARGPAQAAEVYAASLLAIEADSAAEQQYLRDLAAALNLDDATVRQLHAMTGDRA